MSSRRPTLEIAALLLVFALVIAACGGEGRPSLPPLDEDYPADVLQLGEAVYSDTCSVCHGRRGGGDIGPSLLGIDYRLTFDEHVLFIRDGKGAMPAFSGTLTAEEIRAVAAYERVGLG